MASVITVYENSRGITVNTTSSSQVAVVTLATRGPQGATGSPTNFIDDDGTTPSDAPSATGAGSLALGFDADAAGANSFAEGTSVRSSGDFSRATGYQATTQGVYGAEAYASGGFTAIGDAQRVTYLLKGVTNASQSNTFLTTNNSTHAATNSVYLADNTTVLFDGLIVAKSTTNNAESLSMTVSGAIERDSGVGSTALVGKVFKNILLRSNTNWNIGVAANTTTGTLDITGLGTTATTIRWLANINTVSVSN